jgi:phosphoglucosamine mutase
MKRLFGTDGIRGIAGQAPLDPPMVRRFGLALAERLAPSASRPPRVVLGRDTRESGPWLRDAVAVGLTAGGAEVRDAGVITTPGLAFATRHAGFDAGVMISASHNPFEDNGLKVFAAEGTKLPDELEHEIERRILDAELRDPGEGVGAGAGAAAIEDASLVRLYVEHLEGAVRPRGRFAAQRLVLDCANGAAAAIAPEVFRHHGADVEALATVPDGRNINLRCGSLHVEKLALRVREGGFDLGIAFDGDADRALAVDRRGRLVDGDHILYLTARRMARAGELRGNLVVGTVMSNLWLERRLAEDGVRLLRAPVGDKYVLERMIAEDAVLGGEQSGHIIFRNRCNTGDGILTGLLLLETLLEGSVCLESVLDEIRPYPQVLLNVRVTAKPDLGSHPVIGPAVALAERTLGSNGRIVLRYSGTEPLARVMVEGIDAQAVRREAERLVEVIRAELGA